MRSKQVQIYYIRSIQDVCQMYVVFTKFISNFIITSNFVFKFIFIFLDRLFEESFLEFKTINELICFISHKHNNIFCILDILFF